jgi:uncharacterized protein
LRSPPRSTSAGRRLPSKLLAAALLAASFASTAQVPVPPLRARVTDLTGTLAPDQRAALEKRLAALETAKGSQLAILMVPTVQPEAIEQYSIRVFDQWKLGRKNVDDGVLLLVAKNDRRLRIEVGRGLEGAIPDAYAKRIIDEEITPRFRQGDFYGGVSAGVERIAKLVQGEPMPPPKARSGAPGMSFDAQSLFLGFILLMVFTTVLHSLLGRALGSGVVGVAAGFVVYAIAGVMGLAAIVGLVAFVVSLFIGSGSGRGSGWSSGGWSSGGSGFSGGGGGGFSGGGGGSSGGGASGSW